MSREWYEDFKKYVTGEWSDIMIIELVKRLGTRYPDKCAEVITQFVEWKVDQSGRLVIIDGDENESLSIILRTNHRNQNVKQLRIDFEEDNALHYFNYEWYPDGNILCKEFVRDNKYKTIEDKVFMRNYRTGGSSKIRVNKEYRDNNGDWVQIYVEEDIDQMGNQQSMYIKEPNKRTIYTKENVHIKNFDKDQKQHGWEWVKSPDEKYTEQLNVWEHGVKIKEQVYYPNSSALHYNRNLTPSGKPKGAVIYFAKGTEWCKAEFWDDDGNIVARYSIKDWPCVNVDTIKHCLDIDYQTNIAKNKLLKGAHDTKEILLKRKNKF